MVVKTHLEVKMPNKGQDLLLVYAKKESSNLGHFASKIFGWAKEMPLVRQKRNQ